MHMTDTGVQPMPGSVPQPALRDTDRRSFLTLPSLEALLDWLEMRK